MQPTLRNFLLLLCVALGGGGCQHFRSSVADPSAPNIKQHLVIDAGSSGTRFMLYNVYQGPQGCRADFIQDLLDKDHPLKAQGLADLCFRFPKAAAGLMNCQHFYCLHKEHVVLLGTGGFRMLEKKNNEEDIEKYKRCREVLGKELAKRIGKIEVISGEREGEYAWLSVEQQLSTNEKEKGFSILELGGVSVQFATGASGSSLQSKSDDEVGVRSIQEKLDGPAKAFCGLDGTWPGDFEKCRDAVRGC